MCSPDTWNVWWFHVNTLSVTVRYRPVRIGWYVRTGDFEALREALRFTFTMWGGHYNPVIPVDDIEFASSLVRLFRVDVIWPMSKDEGVKKFIDQFPHLPNPFFDEELFVPYGNGERGPQLVDIYHPIRRLYEEQFKNNPSPDTTVTIFEWQAEDPLADVLLATFGAVPSAQVTGTEYLALLQRHLSAKTVRLSPEEPFPQRAGNDWIVSTFCRSFIRQHYSVQNSSTPSPALAPLVQLLTRWAGAGSWWSWASTATPTSSRASKKSSTARIKAASAKPSAGKAAAGSVTSASRPHSWKKTNGAIGSSIRTTIPPCWPRRCASWRASPTRRAIRCTGSTAIPRSGISSTSPPRT